MAIPEIKPGIDFWEPERYQELVRLQRRPFLSIAGYPEVGRYVLSYFPLEDDQFADKLKRAQFAQLAGKKLWVVQNDIAVCLTLAAVPRVVPSKLEINPSRIVTAMRNANNKIEMKVARLTRRQTVATTLVSKASEVAEC